MDKTADYYEAKEFRQSKALTAAIILATFVYILTSSIAFPILCKPFYYAQIGNLYLEQR